MPQPTITIDACDAWAHALATLASASEALDTLRQLGSEGIVEVYGQRSVQVDPRDIDAMLLDLDHHVYSVERAHSLLRTEAGQDIARKADRTCQHIQEMGPAVRVARTA